jgi:hypothetical protein
MKFELKTISSLEKVFAEMELNAPELKTASALQGEVFSFQAAFFIERSSYLTVKAESPLENLEIREAALAPCEIPSLDPSENPHILRSAPGMYPDPLIPLAEKIELPQKQWRTAWITVRIAEDEQPGNKEIVIKAVVSPKGTKDEIKKEITFELEVLPAMLPEQKLVHTEWFHSDCIYSYYGMECWSEEYWVMLEKFIANFTAHGMNLLLTPLWTPPLDTKVGTERPTVQLLGIEKNGDNYTFDFGKLGRWIDICLKNGVKYFEMAHPFTQWGAEFCPKIVIRENGEDKKLFGWHTSSRGEAYKNFLRQLFPQLLKFLDGKGVKDKCFYHISDEPSLAHMDNYKACAEIMEELVEGAPIIDALSNVEFYNNGTVKNPIPANNHIEPFVEAGAAPLWTYYCVSQSDKVPNRFFNFPSSRNRIMGVLMYKYDIYGFLQWGYNFWYSQFSVNQKLDPFKSTDAGRAFPSGDAFMVYPGENGPLDSIRNEVMFEAIQDLRALRKLETLQGRGKTLEFIHEGLDYEMSMKKYPRTAAWILELRERVNQAIVELEK